MDNKAYGFAILVAGTVRPGGLFPLGGDNLVSDPLVFPAASAHWRLYEARKYTMPLKMKKEWRGTTTDRGRDVRARKENSSANFSCQFMSSRRRVL